MAKFIYKPGVPTRTQGYTFTPAHPTDVSDAVADKLRLNPFFEEVSDGQVQGRQEEVENPADNIAVLQQDQAPAGEDLGLPPSTPARAAKKKAGAAKRVK